MGGASRRSHPSHAPVINISFSETRSNKRLNRQLETSIERRDDYLSSKCRIDCIEYV